MNLSVYKRIRASVLSKTLKKEVHDLKNFFKEIGLSMESAKNDHTSEPDIMLYLSPPKKADKEAELNDKSPRARAKSE